jgi:hypothetical protein
MPRLPNFDPARDGYHFANEFTNRVLPGTPVTFETSGLCGGSGADDLLSRTRKACDEPSIPSR